MKLKITKDVRDKKTKELLSKGTEVIRNKERGQAFIDAGVAKEVEAQTISELTKEVSKITSIKDLDALVDEEKKGDDRKGAYDLFDKRRSELEATEKESKKK